MRTNKVIVVIGDRDSGKTTWMKKNLILPKTMHRRKIIVDKFESDTWGDMETFDAPQNALIKVPTVDISDLYTLPTGLFRVFNKNTDIILSEIDRVMYNALIIFEDTTRYVGSQMKGTFKDIVFDTKQRGIDIALVFHSFVDVPAQLARNADIFVIFKTDEIFNAKKFTSRKIKDAFERVQSNSFQHYFEIVEK